MRGHPAFEVVDAGATLDEARVQHQVLVQRDIGLDAGKLIREAAQSVQGGGGGKPEFATAGGKNPDGIPRALELYAVSVKAALQG